MKLQFSKTQRNLDILKGKGDYSRSATIRLLDIRHGVFGERKLRKLTRKGSFIEVLKEICMIEKFISQNKLSLI